MSKIIEIYTDGSSLGNPGPGGFGCVIVFDGEIIEEFGGYDKETTNNRMELVGAIKGLEYAEKNYVRQDITHVIHAHTDSAYVLGGVTSWIHNWEKNGWKTANKKEVLNQDLWKSLIALARIFGSRLEWKKVKGHSGVIYNEKADEIATTYAAKQKRD